MKNENTVNLLNMRNFVIWDLSAPFALKKHIKFIVSKITR
jgi:hypothetical protein